MGSQRRDITDQELLDKTVVQGNTEFALDLYSQLRKAKGNLLLQRYFAFRQGMLLPHPNRREANEHTATSIVGHAAAIGPKKRNQHCSA